MKEKKQAMGFFAVFLLLIVGMGTASMRKLEHFYVNDELDYNEWNADLGSKLETDIASSFSGKLSFVNMNGAIRNLLGQREMNGIVKLNNGWLTELIPYTSEETLQACADHVAQLNVYLQERGTPLLYVATPCTVDQDDPQLPAGTKDFGNENIDRFLEMLRERGVETLDIREEMRQDGIDHYAMMYRTDHHWTTEAGFYTYGKLESWLKEKLDCEVDERISDPDCYTTTTYAQWHLGSRGQKTGRYFAGSDDFNLILPDFSVMLRHGEEVGTIQGMVINYEPLSDKNYMSRYTYDHVLDPCLEGYVNLECRNDKKILIQSDSFYKAVAPYMLMAFQEMRFCDSHGQMMDLIDSYDPDAVILMPYSAKLTEGCVFFDY